MRITLPVSIHAPAEGATQVVQILIRHGRFQSTRPRRARPEMDMDIEDSDEVSIHAPAEGATSIDGAFRDLYEVSIHAPAEGATVAS